MSWRQDERVERLVTFLRACGVSIIPNCQAKVNSVLLTSPDGPFTVVIGTVTADSRSLVWAPPMVLTKTHHAWMVVYF